MDRKLQKLYEKMSIDYVEPIIENDNNFSKFDIQDYTEIIYEGKSGHGDEKAVKNLLKDAYKKGLIDYEKTNGGWMVKSKVDNSQEAIHKGERAYHYLRRYLQKLQNLP